MGPSSDADDEELRGARDADFLAIGLGGTSMMSMLWSVAMGRRAVGVEMRGDPFLGVHWNIREDLYHHLGVIDEMMLARYGEAGLPRRGDGRIFRLAECFYSKDTRAGDIVADEIIAGYDREQHIVGTVHHVEFIDDRWRDGMPNRVVTLLQPPPPPPMPEAAKIRDSIVDVLDGPSTFQAGASEILVLLRRYLEGIERVDLEAEVDEPRVRLFTRHRVVLAAGDGFIDQPDGRKGIRIEALQELDFKGKFVRIRQPGTEVIDLGVPELFMIAEGFQSDDAMRLGFHQSDVEVDHGDGRGPVVAQADFLAGLIEALVGGRLRRRIASEFDADGKEFWVRQIAVGHEDDPEVGWVLVQVPDFKSFDPIEAGLLPAGTDPDSPEFFAAYQHHLYDYYMEQAADILELPKRDLMKVQMVYGPKLFSLVERVGRDAQVAPNGVVAGDSFGNGHFLTSGGAMTGMVGHSARVREYWRRRDEGTSPAEAIRALADSIKRDTEAWLQVSAKEYSEAVPINFGAERISQIAASSGIDPGTRGSAIDASRRKRHSLLPLSPSDWRRVFLRNGQVLSAPLPELHAMHPALRGQRDGRRAVKPNVAYVARSFSPAANRFIEAVLGLPGARVGIVSQVPIDMLTAKLRDRLVAHILVEDCADPRQLADGVNELVGSLGQPSALLSIDDDLQLALGEVRDALRIPGARAAVARRFADKAEMTAVLLEAGLPVARREGGRRFTLEVMTINGVPAWYSATRGDERAVTLPREGGDPADPTVRRMGFAALRALGVASGLSTMDWVRRADGSAAIVDIAARPPRPEIVSLMGLAHDTDMYRAWANAVIHRLFTPIPRLFASGAANIAGEGTGDRVVAVHGWGEIAGQLGPMVVGSHLPEVGQPGPGGGFVLLCHRETETVDRALKDVLENVRVELG